MKGIDEIKARLEAATRGYYSALAFALHAPDDMRRLIARVERLEAALENAEDLADHQEYTLSDMCYQILHIARTALAEEDAE